MYTRTVVLALAALTTLAGASAQAATRADLTPPAPIHPRSAEPSFAEPASAGPSSAGPASARLDAPQLDSARTASPQAASSRPKSPKLTSSRPKSPKPTSSRPGSSRPADAVRYTFDGASPLADVTGHGHDLSPVSRNGGSFRMVSRGGGKAVVFPPPCHREPCPRIALRAPSATALNPGRRPIRFGAAVRLAEDETTKGENVLQKGFSARGSQYKLQVDGVAGQPSCVLVGEQSPRIHVAMSVVSVADDRWHALECRRVGKRLTILVDGVPRGATTVPAELSVSNRIPFSVGGKGSFADNDQFQGTLDEVWVEIG